MIYLNGQIGAVYMGGHYHSEVYLGSVLVWQNVKEIPGDAHAQLAFENTADGVAVVLLPGNVVGTLSLIPVADGVATQTTAPEVHSTVRTEANINGSTNAGSSANIFGNINVKGTPHAEVHGMGIGDAFQGITVYTKPDGDSLTVEIGTGEQDIVLHTPKPPCDVIAVKDSETGIDMKMHTPRPPAVAGIVKPTETGIDMRLLCPSVPALGIVVEKIKALQKIHMAESAEGAGIALGDSKAFQKMHMAENADGAGITLRDSKAPQKIHMDESAEGAGITLGDGKAFQKMRIVENANGADGNALGGDTTVDVNLTPKAVPNSASSTASKSTAVVKAASVGSGTAITPVNTTSRGGLRVGGGATGDTAASQEGQGAGRLYLAPQARPNVQVGAETPEKLRLETQVEPTVPTGATAVEQLQFATTIVVPSAQIGADSAEELQMRSNVLAMAGVPIETTGAETIQVSSGCTGTSLTKEPGLATTKLKLTVSVIGAAVEPVKEKTRAAMFVDGTLETVEPEDFGSLTALPAYALAGSPYKNIYMSSKITTITDTFLLNYTAVPYVKCSPNIRNIPSGLGASVAATYEDSVFDCTDYTFVPALVSKDGGYSMLFGTIKVPQSLLSRWKTATGWEKMSDHIVAG